MCPNVFTQERVFIQRKVGYEVIESAIEEVALNVLLLNSLLRDRITSNFDLLLCFCRSSLESWIRPFILFEIQICKVNSLVNMIFPHLCNIGRNLHLVSEKAFLLSIYRRQSFQGMIFTAVVVGTKGPLLLCFDCPCAPVCVDMSWITRRYPTVVDGFFELFIGDNALLFIHCIFLWKQLQ